MKPEKQIERIKIDTIELPVEKPPYFISPDMEKGIQYYEKYLLQAVNQGRKVLTPASYINAILAQVGETGTRRAEILDHYSKHVGRAFQHQLEGMWIIFNEANKSGVFIKLTNTLNQSESYSFDAAMMEIEDRLKNRKEFIAKPITFLPEDDYEKRKDI